MRVLLAPDALNRDYNKHVQKFGAESGWTKSERHYRNLIRDYQGQWLVVETEYVFDDQFNILEPSIRLQASLCDGVDFEHEEEGSRSYDGLQNYVEHVAAQYARKWPGCVQNCNPIRVLLNRDPTRDEDLPMLNEEQRREINPFFPEDELYGVYQTHSDYRSYLIAGPFEDKEKANERADEIPPEHPARRRFVRHYLLSDEKHPDLPNPDWAPNHSLS